MSSVKERFGIPLETAWVATVVSIAAALVGGALAFPRLVWDRFLWRYFWGPVIADANGAVCAIRAGGQTRMGASTVDCSSAAGAVAEPGYTTVSTVSYALVLLLLLFGVVFLLQRLDAGTDRGFFYALFPFMLFGGALRTVEDANVELLREGVSLLPLPWTALIISPFIYFTVFAIALTAFVGSITAARAGLVSRYEYPLAGVGTLGLIVSVGTLGWLAVTTEYLGFYPIVPTVIVGGATVIAAIAWVGTRRFAPWVNAGTGFIGAVIIWGHTVDGVANVLSLDWAGALGLPGEYIPKHVVNRLVISVTETVQPAAVSAAIGTAWPFLLVKLAAALFVVWVFDETVFEDDPRFTMMLVVTVLAVGLGPGTRDMLRATFGI